ncbi:hypothetical protein CDAR_176801 [Caerostris darwini]|uniref:Uncharacterized protein n=1 Tax=Caerostris darwini TaxID=1538125 RepID=A0AAV4PVW9_9ARAC|nr:hypothetical protein CDAR_176801 [Caerostris darwini]
MYIEALLYIQRPRTNKRYIIRRCGTNKGSTWKHWYPSKDLERIKDLYGNIAIHPKIWKRMKDVYGNIAIHPKIWNKGNSVARLTTQTITKQHLEGWPAFLGGKRLESQEDCEKGGGEGGFHYRLPD